MTDDPTLSPDPGIITVPEGYRSGFVALVGRANVGKSTLMNRLVGSKLSIVSHVPQTTRFPVRGILHQPGLQVVFIDTPGIHKPRYRLNEEMVRLTTRVLKEVDLVAVLVDASEGFGPGDRYVFDLVKSAGARAFLILNKSDLMEKQHLLPLIDEAARNGLFEEIIPLSASTGENCDRLVGAIIERTPPGPPHFPADMLTDLPRNLMIAETIREQVFLRVRQEIPHASAVMVESIEHEDSGLVRVRAVIYVDRDSQKGIMIGERGSMIKEIGTVARRNLEAALGAKVHLALWVKVQEGWRDDTALLRLIGLPIA